MSGGSDKTTDTTASESGPSKFQMPFLQKIFDEAARLYRGKPLEYGPSRVARFNPNEVSAQAGALNYARGGARDVAANAQEGLEFALGDVLSPDSNPNLAKYAEGAARPIFQNLTENVLPSIRGSAIDAGVLGSSRQGIAEGLAVDRTAQDALDTTSRIYSDAYNRGLQTFETGLNLAPEVQMMGLTPYSIEAGVGAQQRAYDQALVDEGVERFQFGQYEPWLRLAQFLSMVGGDFGGEGTSETESTASWFEKLFGTTMI